LVAGQQVIENRRNSDFLVNIFLTQNFIKGIAFDQRYHLVVKMQPECQDLQSLRQLH